MPLSDAFMQAWRDPLVEMTVAGVAVVGGIVENRQTAPADLEADSRRALEKLGALDSRSLSLYIALHFGGPFCDMAELSKCLPDEVAGLIDAKGANLFSHYGYGIHYLWGEGHLQKMLLSDTPAVVNMGLMAVFEGMVGSELDSIRKHGTEPEMAQVLAQSVAPYAALHHFVRDTQCWRRWNDEAVAFYFDVAAQFSRLIGANPARGPFDSALADLSESRTRLTRTASGFAPGSAYERLKDKAGAKFKL